MARTYLERENGREKVREFLLGSLKGTTPDRYRAAQKTLEACCDQVQERDFDFLDEESQDFVMAEAMLDLEADGATMSNMGDMLSAISKRYPNRRYKTSWKVFNEFKKRHPVAEAPAMPEAGLRSCALSKIES